MLVFGEQGSCFDRGTKQFRKLYILFSVELCESHNVQACQVRTTISFQFSFILYIVAVLQNFLLTFEPEIKIGD